MAQKLFYQDDSIQLLESASSQENVSLAESSTPSILKIKRKNKIHSPPPLSPQLSYTSSVSDVIELFKAKPKKLPPVPAPRRLSAITKPIESSENHSVISPRSETISYKEKLRNRFLTVKKQAENSIVQTPINKSSRTNKKDSVHDNITQENEEIELELKKRQSRVDNDDYNFFCNNNNNGVINEEGHSESDKDEDEDDTIKEDENKEDEKDSLIEFLGLDIRDTDVIEKMSPMKINISDDEKEMFWRPIGKFEPFDIDPDKIRDVEEEGIFKPNEPNITKTQLTRLKERLSKDNREWFESDGRLKILSDPRLETSFKPFKSIETTKQKFLETEYVIPKVYTDVDSVEGLTGSNILEIQILSLKFTHHPLFSPEHVLSIRLISFYDQFTEIKNNNKFITLEKTLEALIYSRKRLKNQTEGVDASGDAPNGKTDKYQKEIVDVRNKLYEEGRKCRDLLKSILHTWKYIKIVRNEQKYVNTSVRLVIKKEYDDYEVEKRKWEERIEDELVDVVSEYEESFQEEVKRYKEDLKEWKLKKNSVEDDEQLPERPTKPERRFDVDKIKSEIINKCLECLKPPGEPILTFELVRDDEQVTKDVVNPKELLRRSAVNKTQIFVKVTCGKQDVCKSKVVALNDDFCCDFYETFTIKTTTNPKLLALNVYEQSGMSKKSLKRINLFEKTDHAHQDVFEIRDKTHFNHTGVGSGVNIRNVFKSYDIQMDEEDDLFTSGLLQYSIDSEGHVSTKTLQSNKVASSRILNIKNILQLSQKYIDPQDPQNTVVYEYVKDIEQSSDKRDYFRLEPEMKAFEFCDASEIDNNPRFRMLKLRDRNEPEFQNLVVPNRIKEIPEDAFVAYEKRCMENQTSVMIEEFRKDDIEGQRKWGLRHIQHAENKVIQLCKAAENKISLQDVLTEETIPTLGSLGLTFMNWLQPNRPLRPVRKTTKQSQTSLLTMKDAKIIVNIVGAIQVPVRKDGDVPTIDHMAMIPVRPFVVVTYKDKQARTTVAEGANPIWNQELTLPLENLSETSLQNLNGNLHLHLYDETVSDLMEDDRLRSTNIHQQLGCNWLGGIHFPITTLLYNKRIDYDKICLQIEGTFKLNSPTILLGYESNTTQFYTDTVSHRQDTYLTVFLTMQPTIERNRKIQPSLECSEMEYLVEHIKRWEMEYGLLFPHRQFTSLVVNMYGELSCVTRYFKPLDPPYMADIEINERHCARFVSMIPFKENSMSHKIPSIWLTPEQVLMLSIGSITDHAVLLMCLLMGIGVKCWLLLGYGIPHGPTTYVLTVEKNSLNRNTYFIYDVENAFKYSVRDNFCPLQKVYCLMNDENVWGNVQVEERAHMSRFDVTKSGEWLSLFNKQISAPVVIQQKVTTNYVDSPSAQVIQEKIEKKIKQKIMKWRKHHVTIWNHYVCSMLKQMLPKLEWLTLMNSFEGNHKDFDELHGLFNSYKMSGYALNFPYTSIKNLNSYIRATNIHSNENPNAEFALAVYVHPYPNYTLVVWIYLASLIRRR